MILVFLKNIKTPAIKSINVRLSSVHMFSSMCLLTFMLFTHFGQMTTLKCQLRLVSFLLYVLNLGIVLMKSHTLVRAFQAITKASARERVCTQVQQYVTILILVALSCSLMVVSLTNEDVRILEEIDANLYLKYRFCSSQPHMNVQISFALLLQCFCFASAYRGRNLPGVYSEAMPLIYLSLITTLGFAIMFPIQYFQKDPFTRSSVSWSSIIVNDILFLLFSYGGKLYFVVFKKYKNNAAYFHDKTFSEMTKLAKSSGL